MFRNVVASMNEALDISLHLKPLRGHFKVQLIIWNTHFKALLSFKIIIIVLF